MPRPATRAPEGANAGAQRGLAVHQAVNGAVLDVPPIFAQVDGDRVGAAEMGLGRGPHRVGLVGPSRLPDGGDVVNVDAQLDHA